MKKIDILNRSEFVEQLVHIINTLAKNKKSCTFAINGDWGVGKTFVIDMLEKQLSSFQSEETSNDKYLIFHYNCWEYDYYNEPSIAIVSAMLDVAETQNSILRGKSKKIWEVTKETVSVVAKELTKSVVGNKPFEIVDEVKERINNNEKAKTEYDDLFKFKKSLETARTCFSELADDRTIVIVVDELDRCLPEYAIKVLERLHHMFYNIDNIIVILAVDKKQLDYTVQQIFGMETKTDSYLKKFIDFDISLDKGNVNNKFSDKYAEYISCFDKTIVETEFSTDDYFSQLFGGIDARSQDKIVEKAMLLHNMLFSEKADYGAMCFELLWLILTHKGVNLYANSSSVITTHDPFNSLKNIENDLKEYIVSGFTNISARRIVPSNNSMKTYTFSQTSALELLFWYWAAQFPNSNVEYVLNKQDDNSKLFEQTCEKLKEFTIINRIIV